MSRTRREWLFSLVIAAVCVGLAFLDLAPTTGIERGLHTRGLITEVDNSLVRTHLIVKTETQVLKVRLLDGLPGTRSRRPRADRGKVGSRHGPRSWIPRATPKPRQGLAGKGKGWYEIVESSEVRPQALWVSLKSANLSAGNEIGKI